MTETIADDRSIDPATHDFAKRVLLEEYGLTGQIRKLPGFVDDNFLVEDGADRFVLKIVPDPADRDYVGFQAEILDHLSRVADERNVPFGLPRIVASSSGERIVTVAAGSACDGPHSYGDGFRIARLVTFLPGTTLANVVPHSPTLLRSLGVTLGAVDSMLADFEHLGADRFERWDLARAATHLDRSGLIEDETIRQIVVRRIEGFVHLFERLSPSLPQGVIHNDANDHNVIVSSIPDGPRVVAGLIDFGDSIRTARIFEVAIAATYAMLGKRDPLSAACEIISGYATELALNEDELGILFAAVCARLSVSAITAAESRMERPDNAYLQVSDDGVRDLLVYLESVHADWAEVRFRSAAGLEPCATGGRVRSVLSRERGRVYPVLGRKLDRGDVFVHDMSVAGSPSMPDDLSPEQWTARMKAERDEFAGTAVVGLGRYAEYRLAYSSSQFEVVTEDGPQRRSLHLGVDLFDDAGTTVFAPLAGTIHSVADNGQDLDYGPTLILKHEIDGTNFFTLYGHLAADVLTRWSIGDIVTAGDELATLGHEGENGGWPPHLHLQVMTRLLGNEVNFPGVALASEAESWLSMCPNPGYLVGLSEVALPLVEAPAPDAEGIRGRRDEVVAPSLSVSYDEPLHIVRGRGTYLYSARGRAYLDCVNNVCHVGHSHPRVVGVAARQAAILNTNTRYLHENLTRYAEQICATLPDPLAVAFFVCSGSEANDLAIRLARAATNNRGIAVIDHAYHGNLSSLIDISPYKFDGPGGSGRPDHVAVLPMPDTFRGRHGADVEAYVSDGVQAIRQLADSTFGLSALFAESILSCGGQVDLPPGYLARIYEAVHEAGGVCVADEVQVGFGRVGSDFWGFEAHGVVPDIVTMGKPIGNGHPLAAVVTTRAIADAFANGMEYFNTFGGNPVSCAVGLEVLSVIADEGLQKRAEETGTYLKSGLENLARDFPLIGDVRGRGLFLGIELVEGREMRTPAPRQAKALVNRMKDKSVLLSTDGPEHNVIKIKPPLTFGKADVDLVLRRLAETLREDAMQPGSPE